MSAPKPPAATVGNWLRENGHPLGGLTGQDWPALKAAVQVAQLWLSSDFDGQQQAALAFGHCVRAMQPHLWYLAYHAIAHVGDWGASGGTVECRALGTAGQPRSLQTRMKTLRPATIEQREAMIRAVNYLKLALSNARIADAPKLEQKILSTLKSADGASRHLQRRMQNQPTT